MSYRLGSAFMLLLPALCQAQPGPERLLTAETQLYLRWDGIETHRAAYEKTALGKTLQGDTGKFLSTVLNDLHESIGTVLTVPQLLGGVPPEKLQKIQADAMEAPKFLQSLSRHGVVLGFELRQLEPPEFQLTLIFPQGGEQSGPFLSSLRLGAELAKLAIKESKVAGQTVHSLNADEHLFLTWWIDGKDAVVVLGTDKPEAAVQRARGKGPRLAQNPHFRKVQAFKEFETAVRGFADLASFVKQARSRGKELAKLIDTLGVDRLESLTFHSGFDGLVERGLIEVRMPGPRKGLLRMTAAKPFKLSELPPLPPDLTNFTATKLDYGVFYDSLLEAMETVVQLVAPEQLPGLKGAIAQADTLLGVNLRKDLLGSLGDQLITYTSPAEGPLSLGQTFVLKVKDAKTLQATIDQLLKSLTNLTGANVSTRKRTYHGVEVREVHVRQEGFIFLPTYAFHNDWLVVSYYPQAVHGYILRATGELPAWKPEPQVQAAFDKLPREMMSVSVSDPRPSIKQLLSITPLIGRAVTSFTPDARFDVGAVPNAHEATQHLFPNVSVSSDDGTTFRLETRASLAFPLELAGLDSYALFILFTVAARF